MKLNLTKPLVIFDLETTGLDLVKDRVIQISYIKVYPDGECWIMVTNTSSWRGSRFTRNTGALCRNLRDRFDSQLPVRDLFRE